MTDTNGDDDWDLYWAHGYLTSCANAFPGNYEGRIRNVWETFFARLNPGARILDLATGNGAIALMAAGYSLANQKNFEIHGIDRARINPASAWHGDPAVLDQVSFHSRTPAEHSGFPDGLFAAVTGQYALEYTDLEESVPELARIMLSGGQGRFVMHHPDSVVIRTSQEEVAHGRLIFEETKLFEKGQKLLRCIISAEAKGMLASDPDAQSARNELNEAAARVTGAIEIANEPELLSTALGYVGQAIRERNQLGPEGTLALLDRGQTEIEANLARLNDLLNALVTPEKLSALQILMRTHGIRSEPAAQLSYDHENQSLLMGWLLDVRRQ